VLGTHIGPMSEMPQLVPEYFCRYPRRHQSEVRTEEVEPRSGGGIEVVASKERIMAFDISSIRCKVVLILINLPRNASSVWVSRPPLDPLSL
jgi:hypothetical protein